MKRIFSILLCLCMVLTLMPATTLTALAETATYTLSKEAGSYTLTGGTLSGTTYPGLTEAVAAIIQDSQGTADITFNSITESENNPLIISTACDLTLRGSLTFTNVNTAIKLDAENIHIHNHATLSTNGGYLLMNTRNNTSFEQIEGTLTGGLFIGSFSGTDTTGSLAVKGGTINGTVDFRGSALTMDGGTINGKINLYGSPSFVMNNGTVTNKASDTTSVYAVQSGSGACAVTIKGGKIYAENTAASSSYGAHAIYNCGGSIKLAGSVDISAKEPSGNSCSVYYSSASNFTTIDASGVTGFTSDFTFGPSAGAMGDLSARAVWMSGTASNIETLASRSKLKVIGDSSGTYTSYVPAAYGTGVIMKNPSAPFSQITAGDITEATFTQSGSNITVNYTTGGTANTASYTGTSISAITEDVLAADTAPGCDLIYGAKDKTQSVTGEMNLDTGSSAVINLYGKLSGTVNVIGTGTVNSDLDASGFMGKTKSQINLKGGIVSGTGAKADGAVEYGVLYLTDANLIVDGATVEATGGDAVVAIGTSNVTLQSGTISATGYGVYMTRPSGGGTGGKLTVNGGSITSTDSIGALLNIKVDFGMSGGSITGSTEDLSIKSMTDSPSAKTFTITNAIGLQKISIMNGSNPVIFDVTGATLPSGKSISVTYDETSSKQLFRASKVNYKDFLQNTTVAVAAGSFKLAVQNAKPVKDSPTTVDLYAATDDKTKQAQFFDSASAASPFYTENLYIGSYLSDVKPTVTENFSGWKNTSGTDVTDAQILADMSLYPIYSTSLTAGEVKNITTTGAEIDLATNGNIIFCTTFLCTTAEEVVSKKLQEITPSSGSATLKLTGLAPGMSYTYYMAARNANNALSPLVTVTFTTEKLAPETSIFVISEDNGHVYNGSALKVEVVPASPYGTINTGDITVTYKKVKDGFGNTVTSSQTISEPVEAGTYEIWITTKGGTTFKAISIPLKLGEYTIAQKALTVTANPQSIPYGGSIATAVGNATASALAYGDALDSVTLTATGSSVAAGGTITPSVAVIKNGVTDMTANYAITYSTGKLTITKSTPTVAFGSYPLSYTYSGEALMNPTEAQLALSGALYKDTVFTWYKGTTATGTPLTGAPKDAGTYVMTASIPATDNTNASEIVTSGTITVNSKSITPTIVLPSVTPSYDSKPKTPTVTVKDNTAVIPDTEYTVSYTENTAVGTATVTITDKEGGNYAITKTDANFTINRAAITVKPQSFSITTGNTAPTLALAYTGVFSGETITPSTAPTFNLTKSDGTEIALADAVKAAGTYTITWSNMASTNFDTATNYTVTKTETGTLTVSTPFSGGGSSGGGGGSGSGSGVSAGANAVIIPAKTVAALNSASGNKGLEMTVPAGTVTLDKTALASVSGKGDVKLSIETVDKKSLTDSQKAALGNQAGSALVVDVNIYVNGIMTSTFGGGKLSISVPYTLKPGESADSIAVWFIKDDGTIEPKNGVYNAKTGCVEFTTDHLSRYLIVKFPFDDVAEKAWYYGSVAYAWNNGLFSGTSETNFSPGAAMTRQMIWTVLARMDGKNPKDMAEARDWAVKNGISDGTNPKNEITRGQMAAILYRYAQYKNYDTAQGGMAIREFADYDSIPAFAVEALGWTVNAELLQGSGDKLIPKGSATRAQVAAILQRFVENVVK